MPPAGGDLLRGRRADARRAAGDEHALAVDGGLEGAVLEEVGVEVALVVVPQPPRVRRSARGPRSPVPFSARSVSRVSNWAVRPTYSRTSSGMPKSASSALRASLSGGAFMSIESVPFGRFWRMRLSMRSAGLRRVRGLRELVHHLAGALRLRVRQVEGLAVEVGHGGRCGPSPWRRSRRGRRSCSPSPARRAAPTRAASGGASGGA